MPVSGSRMRNGMALRRVAPPWPMLFNSKMADLLDAKAIAAADPERQKHGQIGGIMGTCPPSPARRRSPSEMRTAGVRGGPDLLLGL
jgi:hypothetical protein